MKLDDSTMADDSLQQHSVTTRQGLMTCEGCEGLEDSARTDDS